MSLSDVIRLAIVYPIVAAAVLLGALRSKIDGTEPAPAERAATLQSMFAILSERIQGFMKVCTNMQNVDLSARESLEEALLEWLKRSINGEYTAKLIEYWAEIMIAVGRALEVVAEVCFRPV